MMEMRDFFIRVDSLLSCLVHRHGKYLEEIGEREEAEKLYLHARKIYENHRKEVEALGKMIQAVSKF
jgi:hypothetical protein